MRLSSGILLLSCSGTTALQASQDVPEPETTDSTQLGLDDGLISAYHHANAQRRRNLSGRRRLPVRRPVEYLADETCDSSCDGSGVAEFAKPQFSGNQTLRGRVFNDSLRGLVFNDSTNTLVDSHHNLRQFNGLGEHVTGPMIVAGRHHHAAPAGGRAVSTNVIAQTGTFVEMQPQTSKVQAFGAMMKERAELYFNSVCSGQKSDIPEFKCPNIINYDNEGLVMGTDSVFSKGKLFPDVKKGKGKQVCGLSTGACVPTWDKGAWESEKNAHTQIIGYLDLIRHCRKQYVAYYETMGKQPAGSAVQEEDLAKRVRLVCRDVFFHENEKRTILEAYVSKVCGKLDAEKQCESPNARVQFFPGIFGNYFDRGQVCEGGQKGVKCEAAWRKVTIPEKTSEDAEVPAPLFIDEIEHATVGRNDELLNKMLDEMNLWCSNWPTVMGKQVVEVKEAEKQEAKDTEGKETEGKKDEPKQTEVEVKTRQDVACDVIRAPLDATMQASLRQTDATKEAEKVKVNVVACDDPKLVLPDPMREGLRKLRMKKCVSVYGVILAGTYRFPSPLLKFAGGYLGNLLNPTGVEKVDELLKLEPQGSVIKAMSSWYYALGDPATVPDGGVVNQPAALVFDVPPEKSEYDINRAFKRHQGVEHLAKSFNALPKSRADYGFDAVYPVNLKDLKPNAQLATVKFSIYRSVFALVALHGYGSVKDGVVWNALEGKKPEESPLCKAYKESRNEVTKGGKGGNGGNGKKMPWHRYCPGSGELMSVQIAADGVPAVSGPKVKGSKKVDAAKSKKQDVQGCHCVAWFFNFVAKMKEELPLPNSNKDFVESGPGREAIEQELHARPEKLNEELKKLVTPAAFPFLGTSEEPVQFMSFKWSKDIHSTVPTSAAESLAGGTPPEAAPEAGAEDGKDDGSCCCDSCP
ncbi:unnamed protein product [Amoebophrya sp. A25]|nr:unnamed protein product [Amoebophrya sp. A25]|eukprot:GSA25T00009097001.1